MGINFPNAPAINQLYPQPAVAGVPVYRWDGQKWLIQTAATATVDNDVGRNLLHNSLFNIWQRGAGPFAINSYTADRWVSSGTGTFSFAQVAASDTVRSQIGDESMVFQLQNNFTGASGAGDYNLVNQKIEGVRRLAGKTVTVSFYAAASVAGLKLGVSLTQSFGSGGSPSPVVNLNGQAVTLATTWARYSVTAVLPSIAGKTLGTNGDDQTSLFLWYSSGSVNAAFSGNIGVQSGTVQIWGVQLEIGSVATPLEKPDPQQDLAKCQRFCCVLRAFVGAYNTAGVPIYAGLNFPVTMRAAPTITYSNNSNSNAGVISTNASYLSNFVIQAAITATGVGWSASDMLASADL
jgi:hypothetical protein